jgi:hypothetical protein
MRTDILQTSYRFLDVLLGATAFGFVFVFLLSIPLLRTTAGGAEKLTYLNVIANNASPPIFWGNRVQCDDHSIDSPERRWVYEQMERALFPAGASHPALDIRISDNYAIADPGRFWTVSVGQPCGEEIAMDAETEFTVDRRTGKVSDGVWVTFALGGFQPYWQRDEHGWTKIPRAAWVEHARRQ